jgi:MFS superfamily sulfate permease-like transporter
MNKIKDNLFPALLVFLVALPLCLGIALASGVTPFAGLIAGIVGGIVVGAISGSHLSVSGPAAGLTVLVANAIIQLNDYTLFLTAVVLAGLLQIVFGLIKAGKLGEYVPNNVIRGMMAAIGLILILKQIPHLVGFDHDFEGDEDFTQSDGENTFTEVALAFLRITPNAALIGLGSLLFLMVWDNLVVQRWKALKFLPGSLLVVIMGILLTFILTDTNWAMLPEHLVNVPVVDHLSDWTAKMITPNFNGVTQMNVWIIALTIALVASLESLLGVEAVDKLDPLKRSTPNNRELIAQGVGNSVSGLLGGIPVTSVVVRSTANISAGATHKMSAILHGVFILLSILLIPHLLNLVPLASLAAVLITVGYKLVKPSIFVEIWKQGRVQFIPFIITAFAILFFGLLKGIGIGMLIGLFYVIKRNFHDGVNLYQLESNYLLRFQTEVTFLNKPLLKDLLSQIPENSQVLIDLSKNERLDEDIKEMIREYRIQAEFKNIHVEFKYNSRTNIPKPF